MMRRLFLGLLAAAVVVAIVSLATRGTASSASPRARASASAPTSGFATTRAPSLDTLAVDESVRSALYDFARRPAESVALESGASGKAAMRAYVSRTMNLETANQRESKKFERISYTDPNAKLLYRESTNGHVMSFQKLDAETLSPTGDGLPEGTAIDTARAVLADNKLIAEAGGDVIGRSEVRGRHVDQEGGSDFLTQQDIVFHRNFDGKPVINSSATVGVLPSSTHDIVAVNLSNWVPASGPRSQIKPPFTDAQARALVTQLVQKLGDVLAAQLGADAKDAKVRGVEEGWFSSDRFGLVPALVFAVELKTGQTVAVAMLPYHDSAEIWQQGRRIGGVLLDPEQTD